MRDNFKCDNCGHQFFESNHKTYFRNDKIVYTYKNGKQIECPECKSLLISTIPVDRGEDGYKGVQIGKYSSMSMVDKKKSIQKRAKAHTEKKMREEITEVRRQYGINE